MYAENASIVGEMLLRDSSQPFRYPRDDVAHGTLRIWCNVLQSLENVYVQNRVYIFLKGTLERF